MITVNTYHSGTQLPLTNDHHCIVWATKANGHLAIDNKTFELGPGQLLTVGKNQKLSIDHAHIEGYYLLFDDSDFPTSSIDSVCRIILLYNHFNMHNQLIIPEASQQEFRQLFQIMHTESFTSQEPAINPVLSLLLQTLLLKMEQFIKNTELIDLNKNTIEEAYLTKFLTLLEKHYTSKHQVKDYAELMNLPSRKLNDIIKIYLGITAKEIITSRLYIEIARRLQFTSETIKGIAYQMGFNTPYHMSNFFTKTKGISPQAYRDLLKK
ncbi:helix-turn-helix transcriptional regulator [Carboxylicivirga mesophila]|uniref:Helix-turn-helix transcriptional regulator n=1 Tax=Carboxylicivirga mesophila TaxID=1166478 RepID=A0ABS5KGA7_9BACT|nr:AraC family transcriptional regulator [Carboxylicivirga mesophila]MBS2213970.1 helix-turn-helix transcriptional regulator [Carboxylicivirga mesophila]